MSSQNICTNIPSRQQSAQYKNCTAFTLMFGLGIWNVIIKVVFTYFQLFKHVKCHFYFLYVVIHFLKFPSTLNLLQWFREWMDLTLNAYNRLVNIRAKNSDIFLISKLHVDLLSKLKDYYCTFPAEKIVWEFFVCLCGKWTTSLMITVRTTNDCYSSVVNSIWLTNWNKMLQKGQPLTVGNKIIYKTLL